MKNLFIAFVLILTSTLSLQAQTPQGFNYQATVRNAGGELIISQNVNFRFNVQQGSATSDAVFTETHLVSTDDLGQVNLVIGEGTATTGDFTLIDWSLGSYFLGIELNTEITKLLVPTPPGVSFTMSRLAFATDPHLAINSISCSRPL